MKSVLDIFLKEVLGLVFSDNLDPCFCLYCTVKFALQYGYVQLGLLNRFTWYSRPSADFHRGVLLKK
jgi:hypothetical protein